MAEMAIDGKKLMQTLTVKIRMPRAFGFRVWLAIRILSLAGWVSPVGLEVETSD